MTPWQAAVGVVGAVWVGWLVARLLLLWSRVARQGMARAVAPGRPTLRLEFPPSVWLEIMEGPRLGWRRRCRKCWWRVARQADHLIPAARGGHNDASNPTSPQYVPCVTWRPLDSSPFSPSAASSDTARVA